MMSMYFGDVYVFLMQTSKILQDVYFISITNECTRNLILSAYATYLL